MRDLFDNNMVYVPDHELQAPTDGSFRVGDAKTRLPGSGKKIAKATKKALKKVVADLDEFQQVLYAQDKHAILCVFQAMDAAGKDSTIRAVLGKLNPQGVQVHSFKKPSASELDHDFLWRTAWCLPERGCIGVFNRSYYEEVLVVKVHPEFLAAQRLVESADHPDFWSHRYESIRDHEKHLVRNGTVILKFWLNVSPQEQKARFLSRIDEPEKNWKFSDRDLVERQYWDDYMQGYEDCIRETSTPYAPWYVIPADDKPTMRLQVAEILRETMEAMNLKYPQLPKDKQKELQGIGKTLRNEN